MSNNVNSFGNLTADQQAAWRLDIFSRMTNQHLAARSAQQEAADLKDAQDIENRKIMEGILAENEQKAKVDAYNLRELQNRNLEEDLKRQFLDANPAATIYSWLSVKEQIKQDYFLERFNAEKNRDELEAEKYAGYKM
jgi:hypothetical protein